MHQPQEVGSKLLILAEAAQAPLPQTTLDWSYPRRLGQLTDRLHRDSMMHSREHHPLMPRQQLAASHGITRPSPVRSQHPHSLLRAKRAPSTPWARLRLWTAIYCPARVLSTGAPLPLISYRKSITVSAAARKHPTIANKHTQQPTGRRLETPLHSLGNTSQVLPRGTPHSRTSCCQLASSLTIS